MNYIGRYFRRLSQMLHQIQQERNALDIRTGLLNSLQEISRAEIEGYQARIAELEARLQQRQDRN